MAWLALLRPRTAPAPPLMYCAAALRCRTAPLCCCRYDVQYVRNFTDIDDKIIARAAERGEDPLALAGRFITEFHEVRFCSL